MISSSLLAFVIVYVHHFIHILVIDDASYTLRAIHGKMLELLYK